jgi:murein L,D-transpeptidase YcbB/YkuD
MRFSPMKAAVALAALATAAPGLSATMPETAPAAISRSASPAVASFYAARHNAPLWLRDGALTPAAQELIGRLRTSQIEGFARGPLLAAEVQALVARGAALDADRLLSSAWVDYVATLRSPPRGMTYVDAWIAPKAPSAQEILFQAGSADDLAAHVRSVTNINAFYSALREAGLNQLGAQPDARVIANLERARAFPSNGRYVVVDTASARLWMVENGRPVDSMKVIVGKPSSQTPMLASVIYFATLNPYWNVPDDLVRKLTAQRVLNQGLGYLKQHNYQVVTDLGEDATLIPPSSVDWKAVAEGRASVNVRQLPGPANSMGQVKFPFENSLGIYLHDSPEKELFGEDNRNISNGCIRLEDAPRLERWLMGGRLPVTTSSAPEQHVRLPKPVPIYITYLTAQADGGQLTFLDDVYGRDQRAMEMASLGR